MVIPSSSCDLCGLPLHYQKFTSFSSGRTFHFCCMGCKQVFHMLQEASEAADPSSFRETELFKKCQDMGIIPRSEADLKARVQLQQPPSHQTPSEATEDGAEHGQKEIRTEGALSLNLLVDGMWCPACAWVIEETLRRTPGIAQAFCNFSTDRIRCDYNPVVASPQEIINAINDLGYKASLPGEGVKTREKRAEFIRLAVSALLTMNVMMLSFAVYSGFFSELSQESIRNLSWPAFLMTSIVLFYGGRNIYRRSLAGISSAAFGMETLISVGASSAYLYSTYRLLSGSIHLYFDTACMLITLVLLGKSLERRAKAEVQEDLANFLSLRPTKVRICADHQPEGRYVAAHHLRKGDPFRIEEGEILPADGVITEGRGTVDESSLTGEALPVLKKVGDRVKSGARVTQGTFKVLAEAVGQECTLGQMIEIIERALERRTPLESKTDLALQWFVPVILALAAGTGAVCLLSGLSLDEAMVRAVTVMVISCPCTLGIAVPLARVAGISLAGKKGILVRDFLSFEQAARVSAFVLDKTGTVTSGQWRLLEIIAVGALPRDEILALAAALERDSDHPVATEIRRQAERQLDRTLSIDKVKLFQNGVSGVLGSEEVKLGSRSFLAGEPGKNGMPSLAAEKPEQSQVFMTVAGRLIAIFVFGDELKTGSIEAVKRLRAAGRRVALVSGDAEQTARAIAREVGIEEAHGGKLPQGKAAFVASLQEQGQVVAMVGDGINDAPALVQADLAIAVHSGAHLGQEAADLTLMRGDLLQVIDFLELAGKVKRKIHQNLLCSLVYNIISIPVAMSGLLTPLVAVCAMLLSSLSVIGNTVLLVKKGE